MNISSTKVKTVTYKMPLTEREAIGARPRHEFKSNDKIDDSYVPLADPSKGGDQVVFASQPVRNDKGEVKFKEVQAEVDLTPRSPLLNGLGWGAAATAAGSFAGILLGEVLFKSPGLGALAGGLVAGGVTGGLVAHSVAQEKTELVWDEHQVYQHSMKGYYHLAGLGEKNGQTGFFHRYVPDVESKSVDSYKTPRVVRYKGESVPVELSSVAWPQAQTKREPKTPNREIDITVSYNKEHLEGRYVGTMPRGYHSYSSSSTGYTDCGPDGCKVDGGYRVSRDLPVYEPNQDPRIDAVNERITEKAASIGLRSTIAGAVGGWLGSMLGLATAAIAGVDPVVPLAIGGALGAGAGALLGGRSAADDRVRIEWREESVDEGKMVGYEESVSTHYKTECTSKYNYSEEKWEQECEQVPDGYDHSFYAKMDYWSVGSYVKPVVVHYSAKEAGEA